MKSPTTIEDEERFQLHLRIDREKTVQNKWSVAHLSEHKGPDPPFFSIKLT